MARCQTRLRSVFDNRCINGRRAAGGTQRLAFWFHPTGRPSPDAPALPAELAGLLPDFSLGLAEVPAELDPVTVGHSAASSHSIQAIGLAAQALRVHAEAPGLLSELAAVMSRFGPLAPRFTRPAGVPTALRESRSQHQNRKDGKFHDAYTSEAQFGYAVSTGFANRTVERRPFSIPSPWLIRAERRSSRLQEPAPGASRAARRRAGRLFGGRPGKGKPDPE